jgi:hypothetical protein
VPTPRALAGTEITPDKHQLDYIGGGENWMIKLQPEYYGVDTTFDPYGLRMTPSSVYCLAVGSTFSGGYIHPAKIFPPLKS